MIALEESDIIITYSEINSNNNDDLPIDVDYKRNDTINIIRYKIKKGAFEYVSFEPYTLRFIKVHVIKGKVKECSIEIVKYEEDSENPNLTELLEEIALVADVDEEDEDND